MPFGPALCELVRNILADQQAFIDQAKNLAPSVNADDYRHPKGYSSGGFAIDDPVILGKLRNALKYMIGQVGRRLMSGKFELSTISFPIWCMEPYSGLQLYASISKPISQYLTAAALTDDPVQRMKLVMTASMAYMFPCHKFGKPLNPVLGETYQAVLEDGGNVTIE